MARGLSHALPPIGTWRKLGCGSRLGKRPAAVIARWCWRAGACPHCAIHVSRIPGPRNQESKCGIQSKCFSLRLATASAIRTQPWMSLAI
eukprot:3860408-Pyramimonas_sp.AAC.1